MKITFDSTAFWGSDLSFEEQYATIAEIGYEYISPCNQTFPGLLVAPKVTDAEVRWHKKAIADAGLKVASFVVAFRIADPDEFLREAAIKHWMRMFEIAEIMGVNTFNSELGGDPHQPALCEEKIMRSLDYLVPIMEKRGIRMDIQAHPFDFYETNKEAASIVRAYDSKSLGYLYSLPHAFHYDGGKGDVAAQLEECKDVVRHLIIADTYDYTKKFRYNVNPPNADARVHAHIGKLGDGDLDLDAFFIKLREMKFGLRDDAIVAWNPLGFPERVREDGIWTLNMLKKELIEKQQ